jgi:hypothetical protein
VSIRLSPTVFRQRLCENFTAATNTRTTKEELFDASFFVRYLFYHEKKAINSSQNFLQIICILSNKKNGKAIPVTDREGP